MLLGTCQCRLHTVIYSIYIYSALFGPLLGISVRFDSKSSLYVFFSTKSTNITQVIVLKCVYVIRILLQLHMDKYLCIKMKMLILLNECSVASFLTWNTNSSLLQELEVTENMQIYISVPTSSMPLHCISVYVIALVVFICFICISLFMLLVMFPCPIMYYSVFNSFHQDGYDLWFLGIGNFS